MKLLDGKDDGNWLESSELKAPMAFVCLDIDAPSQAWARRLINGLAPNVKLLITRTAIFEIARNGAVQLIRKSLRSRLKRSGQNNVTTSEIRKHLVAHKISIVVVHFANVALTHQEAWRNLDVRVIVYCHGIDVHFDGRSDTYPNRRIHSPDYRSGLRSDLIADVLIANSSDTLSRLLDVGIEQSRVRQFNFGVTPQPLNDRPNCQNRELNLLFLGRLIDCKGPDLVLEGFSRALENGLNARLRIAGTGQLMTTCLLRIHDLNLGERVDMLGEVESHQTGDLYRDSDVFVSHHRTGPITQRVEAFGVTLIEAMSYGLPVITARSGGVVDIVNAGENGYLVESTDVAEFSERLLHIANSPTELERLSLNARQTVIDKFSFQQQAAAWRDLITELSQSR